MAYLDPVDPPQAASGCPQELPDREHRGPFGKRGDLKVAVAVAQQAPQRQASLEEAADNFGLDIDAVRWAQSYELSQHAAARTCVRLRSASTSTLTCLGSARSSLAPATT
jgi:hypothetical protein